MAVKSTKKAGLKKQWIQIISPKIFSNYPIGESYILEPRSLLGRKISTNLSALTGDPKRQNINVFFTIKDLHEKKVSTELVGYRINPANLKRYARRNRGKIDDSFEAVTMDGKILRIKPLIVTRSKAANSVLTKIRMDARSQIAKALTRMKFEDFMIDA